MTVMAQQRYRGGKAISDAFEGPLPAADEFDWIGLCDPTPEEIARVQQRYQLHPLAVEDAMTTRQAPKAEAYGQQLFVIARTAAKGEGDKIDYGQTAIFLGENFIVTVRQGSTRAHVKL